MMSKKFGAGPPLFTEAILESISDGVFTVDGNWLVTSFNRAVEAMSVLFSHHWPGNIRELENVIERAFILCGSGEITLHHLPGDLLGSCPEDAASSTLRSARGILDAQAIVGALARNGNSRTAAARELGIHKTTLFRRMKKLGMVLPEVDGRHRRASRE